MKNLIAAILLSLTLSLPVFAEEADADYSPEALILKEKATRGDTQSAYNLAACYHLGSGCPQNDEAAAKWLTKAAGAGDTDAMINLGDFYHMGIGVKQDDIQALVWYHVAAGHGSAEGEYNIAKVYVEGNGVKPDPAQAKLWFLRAANQGLGKAQIDVARLFMQENDYPNAYLWSAIAAKYGETGADSMRERVRKTLSGDQVTAVDKKVKAWRAVSENAGYDQRRAGNPNIK
jgi:TPR repeat protein